MSERSWYDVMRRRVAPIAFLLAISVLAYQTCRGGSSEVELVVRFGDDRAALQSIRIDVLRQESGASVAFLERRFTGRAPAELHQSIPLADGMYRLEIELGIDGAARRLERIIDVDGSGGIRVDLSDAIAGP